MTDDPYPSITPLANALVGGFVALMTIALPVFVVLSPHYTNLEESIKINKQSYKT